MFDSTEVLLGGHNLQQEFGLYLVKIDSGITESHFGITQSIIEDSIENIDTPFFYGVKREPFTFQATFVRQKEWDFKTRLEFNEIVFKRHYQEFISADYPYILYRVICVDEPNKVFFGEQGGYVSLNFRTDSPYAWSPVSVQNYDLSQNITKTTIQVENRSNVIDFYYPQMEFTLLEGSDISFKNLTDGGREFTFTGLIPNETVSIDNQWQVIKTDVPNVYRYVNCNRQWLRLRKGVNYIDITGKCYLSFRLQVPIAI